MATEFPNVSCLPVLTMETFFLDRARASPCTCSTGCSTVHANIFLQNESEQKGSRSRDRAAGVQLPVSRHFPPVRVESVGQTDNLLLPPELPACCSLQGTGNFIKVRSCGRFLTAFFFFFLLHFRVKASV